MQLVGTAIALMLATMPVTTPDTPPDTTGPRVVNRFSEPQQPENYEDEWLAIDKAQHFLMSYGSAMFAYGALRAANVDQRHASAAAVAGSLALGVGKELFDRRQGGPFSGRDLVWDALGTLAGLAFISLDR